MSGEVRRDSGAPSRLTVPPDLSRLREVRAWAWEAGSSASLSESRLFDLQVTVSEATANAIEHAASAVELTAWLLPDRLLVEVTNDGVFQPGLYKDHDGRRRGLGLPLMVSLADQVHVARLDTNKTMVSLTFFLGADRGRGMPPAADVLTEEPTSEGRAPARWLGRAVWLPLPLLILAAAVLYGLGLHSVHENAVLITALNTLFVVAASLVIAFLAARSYLLDASRSVLVLGAGALVFGLLYLLAGPLVRAPNEAVTIANTAILLGGALFLASAVWALAPGSRQASAKGGGRAVLFSYLGAVIFVGLLTFATIAGWTPRFYTAGQGFSPLRIVFLSLGAVAFLLAGGLFGLLYRRVGSRFLLWCSCGLGMAGVAFSALALSGALPGSPLNWLIRAGICVGGVYLLVGVFSLEGRGGWVLPLERSLREAEARYKSLVDLSPDPILVSASGRWVFANPAAVRFFGASFAKDIIGKEVLELVAAEDREYARARMDLEYAGAVTPPRVGKFSRLDGSLVEAEVTGTRIEFDGQPAIQLMMRDTTERRRAEEELSESEGRLRLALEAADYGTWDLDLVTGRAVRSLRHDQIFGYEELQPEWTLEVALRHVSPEDHEKVIEAHTPAQGKTAMYVEGRMQRVDGSTGWFMSTGRFHHDDQGRPVRIIGVCADITERKQAEERLLALAEENERLYRQQLDIAENLQAAFLHIPSEAGPVRLGHLYRSATEAARVGGDFYDVFEVKDYKIAVLMGDVAGHGIEAARTATLVKDVVHAFIHQTLRTHEVLKRTNRLLIEKEMPGYVTLFLGILDTETGELRYSSAGHPDMFLRRASAEIEHLGAGSAPLGIYADAAWKPCAVELESDDLLVLFTDGVIEARRKGELFGEKRLEALVRRKRIPAERLPDVILDQVLAFSGGLLQDDLAILTLRLLTKGEAAPSKRKSSSQEKLVGQ